MAVQLAFGRAASLGFFHSGTDDGNQRHLVGRRLGDTRLWHSLELGRVAFVRSWAVDGHGIHAYVFHWFSVHGRP